MSKTQSDDNGRDQQLDAIIHRYYADVENGRTPNAGELISANPAFADELSEFFASIALVSSDSSRVDLTQPLVREATDEAVDSPSSIEAPRRDFGEYELLEKIGSGGMGVVFKARQRKIMRIVALKMIRAGKFANSQEIQRFRGEAKSAAKLSHPGIIAIYEVGVHNAHHFYTMEFVDGGNLSEHQQSKPLTSKYAAGIVKRMSEAIAYAHSHGIVHRDLKPANVLLTQAGEPRIADFGLAKQLQGDGETDLHAVTETGQILGTAGYMAPEQAEGNTRNVGPLADVYALGAVLYALLTNRAPFIGETTADTLFQVLHNQPIAPRELNPGVPRDLETICLKALEKQPHRRYATAQLMAEDLERFLDGRPVTARSVNAVERGWRWCRRNPRIAAMICMIFLSLIGGTVVSAFFARQANNQAVANRIMAEKERAARQQADEYAKDARKNLYLAHMNLIEKAWEEGRVNTVRKLLALYVPDQAEDDLRFFEWYFWWRRCHEDLRTVDGLGGSINAVAYCPTKSLVMSADESHTIKLWDEMTGECLHTLVGHTGPVTSVAFSPDGNFAASSARDNTVIIWDINSRLRKHTLSGHTQAIARVVFSSDGDTVASASLDGTAKFWGARTGELKTTLSFGEPCRSIALSPDGRHAAAVHGATLTIVELDNGLKKRQLSGASRLLLDVAFSPDNRTIATAGEDRAIRLWSIDKPGAEKLIYGHSSTVNRISFNGDGSLIASASVDLSTKIWSVPSGLNVATYRGHIAAVNDVAFSADSSRVVSASLDGTLKIWDATQPERVHRVLGSINAVKSVAISHDGKHIAFSNIDGSVQLLRASDESSRTFRVHDDSIQRVAFHPREPLLAGASLDGSIHLLKVTDGDVPATFSLGLGPLESIDFSPNSAQVVVGCRSGKIALWDSESKQVTGSRAEHQGSVLDTRFSPNGKQIASCGSDHTVKIWYLETDSVKTFKGHTDSVTRVAFCPTRHQLASASRDGTAKVWDLDTGAEVMELAGHTAEIYSLVYSPDGSRIATASLDGSVKLWDAFTGEETLTLVKERSQADDLAFTPDGRRLVTPSPSGRLHIWDASHEQSPSTNVARPAPLPGQLVALQKGSLTCVLHTQDGRKLVWAGHDHIAHLWDIRSQQEVQTFHGHEGPIWTLDFSRDGRVLVTGSEDKTVRFWDLHTGQQLHRETTGGIVSCLRFSAEGKTLVANNWDGKIRVWEMLDEGLPDTLQVFSYDSIVTLADKSKSRFPMTPLGLSLPPREEEQFIVGGPTGELWLCNLITGTRLRAFEGHANKVHSVAISPSGDKVLSASHDCTIRRWDLKTGRSERVYYGHTALVHEARFLPNGENFVSASADGSVRLWNAATGEQLAFGLHGNDVRGLSVAPDGRSCVSVGFDGAVRSWDLPAPR